MKQTRWTNYFVLIALAISLHFHTQAAPLGTAFTYQGRLMDGGNAANGVYELRLGVFTTDQGGNPFGNLLTNRKELHLTSTFAPFAIFSVSQRKIVCYSCSRVGEPPY